MKNKNLLNSFKYAFMGIGLAFKTERNLKIHFSIMSLVIIMGLYFQLEMNEWLACILCFGMVISSEMMNTAMEANTDLAMPDINPKAKLAKDVSAGAVLVSAITSLIVGIIIFGPKISMLFR